MAVTMSLKDDNYDVTEGECPNCEEGDLWVNTHELVCDVCYRVFRGEDKHALSADRDPTDEISTDFYENRFCGSEKHRYAHSNKPILPGGFEQAYEYTEDELLDG